VDVEHVQFAVDTSYETDMAIKPPAPKRVLAPEVVATVRRALMAVVAEGTGARLRNTYRAADGSPLAVEMAAAVICFLNERVSSPARPAFDGAGSTPAPLAGC
jgi:hypothetical protein